MSKALFLKTHPIVKTGLNLAFAMAGCSLCFCWLYGIPPLLAGYVALSNLLWHREAMKSSRKKAIKFKLKWGIFMAWAGLGFSLVFSVLYIIAWATGAYIRV